MLAQGGTGGRWAARHAAAQLRHTAAAAWLTTGKPLMCVQRQLGHSSITTTERCYGHLEASFLKGAAEETEAAIWGNGDPAGASVAVD